MNLVQKIIGSVFFGMLVSGLILISSDPTFNIAISSNARNGIVMALLGAFASGMVLSDIIKSIKERKQLPVATPEVVNNE